MKHNKAITSEEKPGRFFEYIINLQNIFATPFPEDKDTITLTKQKILATVKKQGIRYDVKNHPSRLSSLEDCQVYFKLRDYDRILLEDQASFYYSDSPVEIIVEYDDSIVNSSAPNDEPGGSLSDIKTRIEEVNSKSDQGMLECAEKMFKVNQQLRSGRDIASDLIADAVRSGELNPDGSAPNDKPGGSTPKQYALPEGAKELQDLIEYRNMNFALGNIFKASFRSGNCEHSDELREIRKILWFANRELKRLEKKSYKSL